MPKEKKETSTEVVKFDVETQVIVALDTKYKDVQITDGKSKDIVMAGLAEYRELRLAVVDGHKETKAKILKDGNWLDSEKRRILARLAPGEEHLKGIRQVWDDEKERIKAEKEAKEQARKDGIQAKIHEIRMATGGIAIWPLKDLRALSSKLEEIGIDESKYMEFTEEAEKAVDASYNAVQDAIATRIKLDKEAEERKAEDARLEKIRKKQEDENKKIKAAQKKIDDEKDRIAKNKEAEQDRKTNFRTGALFSTGLKWDGEQYCFMDVNVHWTDIVILSDDEFNKLIEDLRLKINSRKKDEADRIAKEATEKAEAAATQKLKDAASAEEERVKTAAAEKAQKEALAPDKEKLNKWIQGFNAPGTPLSLKSKAAKEIYRIAWEEIEIILQNAMIKTEEL